MSDDTYTVTVPMRIAASTCDDIITNALYAQWGWWGDAAKVDETHHIYSIEEIDDDGRVVGKYSLPLRDVAQACARIITEDIIRPDLAKQVASALTPDPDIDADAADCILQLAVFGELRYG